MGGEYLSIEFLNHLKNCDIVSQLTPPKTPQLNDVAERRNRTLLDMVRSMMCQATLPVSFWGYALETAAHILNLVPTKKVLKTPLRCGREKVLLLGTSKSGVVRTSSRVSKPPQFYYGFHIKEDKISNSILSELDEPANYKEAMESHEAAKWKEAMKS
nr:retrotransposon protein, putative, Ty1-copia subclass [Tanacetum cinerariifolium]